MTSVDTMIENRKFDLLEDLELPRVLSNCTIRNCQFFACHYGMTAVTPAERRLIKDINLIDCVATNNSSVGPVLVEDVTIDGLQTRGLCMAWGAVFRRVRIRGRCGKFMLSPLVVGNNSAEKIQRFEEADRLVYESTDWALDISEAEFEEFDVRSVPAHLVRRDPETQVIVRRSRVEATEEVWRGLDLSGTPWLIALSDMRRWGLKDQVLVAPKRRRDFARWLSGLRLLQREGVAECD